MSDKNQKPLKVALHGMDNRSIKTMMMFLEGPCRGCAVVVEEEDAEVDIYDNDILTSKNLLGEHLRGKRTKPIIVLSLSAIYSDRILQVKKPVSTDAMLAVLKEAKEEVIRKTDNKSQQEPNQLASTSESEKKPLPQTVEKNAVDLDENKKTSKHQTAMRLDESSFQTYLGLVSDVNVNDPSQFSKASYDPKDYFQGYFQSALMVSKAKGQIMQLQSGWKPINIFPHSHEVWLDSDDAQLRAFAGIKLNANSSGKMSLTPLTAQSEGLGGALDKFQSSDAFLWKLACWTSKGRFPQSIDYTRPVFLKRWPNFTRLLITPHAFRISALLIQGPRTLANVAEVLNIKPQYVFVFASASNSLGLLGQASRHSDNLVQPPEIKSTKTKGLLSRIMSRLRS